MPDWGARQILLLSRVTPAEVVLSGTLPLLLWTGVRTANACHCPLTGGGEHEREEKRGKETIQGFIIYSSFLKISHSIIF